VADELIHLMVRETDAGLYATSPQAPGFLYGRRSKSDFFGDLQDALAFHFDESGPFTVVFHHEREFIVAGDEIVVRLTQDEFKPERIKVFERLRDVSVDEKQAKSLTQGLRNPLGEVVYVCTVASDTVGWLSSQLDERGDAFTAAISIAEGMLITFHFAYGDLYSDSPSRSLTEGPYNDKTTMSEVLQTTMLVTPVSPAKLIPGSASVDS
jgi:hypothetical protein